MDETLNGGTPPPNDVLRGCKTEDIIQELRFRFSALAYSLDHGRLWPMAVLFKKAMSTMTEWEALYARWGQGEVPVSEDEAHEHHRDLVQRQSRPRRSRR